MLSLKKRGRQRDAFKTFDWSKVHIPSLLNSYNQKENGTPR